MNIMFKTGLYFLLVLTVNCLFFSIVYAADQAAATSGQSPAADPVDVIADEAQAPEAQEQKAQQYYIVEIILFQHLNEQGKLSEIWSSPEVLSFDTEIDSNLPFKPPVSLPLSTLPINAEDNMPTDDIPALAEYDLQTHQFIPLRNGIAETSAENYKLADSAAHLRYSPKFRLLAHFGWTQRSLEKNQALPIRITANQFSDQLMPVGEIKLYVSRYLHMQVDLQASECLYNEMAESETDQQLDQQLENAGTTAPAVDEAQQKGIEPLMTMHERCENRVYVFKQNRKMRSRELHYIDNPVFGMLVYVTPLSITKEALPETEGAEAAIN